MPDKHVSFGESLLGLSAFIYNALAIPQTIDDIWYSYQRAYASGAYSRQHTLENVLLALDALYALGSIDVSDKLGLISRCA